MHYRVVAGAVACLLVSAFTKAPRTATRSDLTQLSQQSAPRSADIDALLAADRAYSAASASTDLVTGLTAMFAPTVTMPVPGVLWANGIGEATKFLRANSDNAKSRAEWTPIRAGISGDGQQGFTFGFMTVHVGRDSTQLYKYMSYWIKNAKGWQVAAYKRARRRDSTVALTLMPPSLPERSVAITTDRKILDANASGLKAAEQNFSDEANKIGLGAAFAKTGTGDAVNMGSGAGYTVGATAIAAMVSGPSPAPGSPYIWNADKVIVASSGDLGITFGVIHQTANPSAPGSPFFTIWRRASQSAPWRYIAE